MFRRISHARMILMQVAYCVHGAIAPVLPFEIPKERKQQIKDIITAVEETAARMTNFSQEYDDYRKKLD